MLVVRLFMCDGVASLSMVVGQQTVVVLRGSPRRPPPVIHRRQQSSVTHTHVHQHVHIVSVGPLHERRIAFTFYFYVVFTYCLRALSPNYSLRI